MEHSSHRLHLAIIDPAVKNPEFDNFNRLSLSSSEISLSYHVPALFGMGSLENLIKKPDALVIFGSGASVYDAIPWQESLNSYILECIRVRLPILGICYGHQLLAHLLGGRVQFAHPDQIKFKGLRKIHFKQTGFWGQEGETGDLVVSHREIVTDLPQECQIFASSTEVLIEGFFHKSQPLWGIQSHPEAGPEFIKNQDLPTNLGPSVFDCGHVFMQNFVKHLRTITSPSASTSTP